MNTYKSIARLFGRMDCPATFSLFFGKSRGAAAFAFQLARSEKGPHTVLSANSLPASYQLPDYRLPDCRLPITNHELTITCRQSCKSPANSSEVHNMVDAFQRRRTILASRIRVLFWYRRFSGMMYYDYNKRSYLLPPGCKDLIDLLHLEEQKKQASIQLPMLQGLQGAEIFIAGTQEILAPWKLKKKKPKEPSIAPVGAQEVTREVAIPESIIVRELANIAGQKPFKIIADLMEFGIFANVNHPIPFEAASRILKKYGILAKKAA